MVRKEKIVTEESNVRIAIIIISIIMLKIILEVLVSKIIVEVWSK